MSSFDWSNPTVVRLLDRYTTLNRKCLPQDAEQSRVVREVAEYYAANYEGDFEFMLSMRKAFDTWHSLTVKQASATVNCLLAEYKHLRAVDKADSLAYAKDYGDSSAIQQHYAEFKYPQTEKLPDLPAEIAANKASERAQKAPKVSIRELPIRATCSACGELTDVSYDTSLTPSCIDKHACATRMQDHMHVQLDNTPVVPQCKNGTYTIVLDETGDYRTIKLTDAPESYNKPQGTQIAAYLSGSDNETNYTGFAFITGTRINVWSKFDAATSTPLTRALRVLLGADRDTQIDMGHAYAIESGACFICGRKLTVPASLHRGMGPICAEKY